jgi:hypothetical protein
MLGVGLGVGVGVGVAVPTPRHCMFTVQLSSKSFGGAKRGAVNTFIEYVLVLSYVIVNVIGPVPAVGYQ